jgi:hypothetical protein
MESAEEREGKGKGAEDRGIAEDVLRGRAEGIRRTVCAPFGAADISVESRVLTIQSFIPFLYLLYCLVIHR